MAEKRKGRFSHKQYVEWGRQGTSPILQAAKTGRVVKGWKVTHVGKGK